MRASERHASLPLGMYVPSPPSKRLIEPMQDYVYEEVRSGPVHLPLGDKSSGPQLRAVATAVECPIFGVDQIHRFCRCLTRAQ
ncbi:hypothetical protein EVAR_3920_1 [Eumeta japonica]|uniref:Uncharacterized protein n=1 Tax=Eumeta variegata TaxID=151549 RepID=A0A4C1SQR8_EUMVA|nr:hypothetical protein EVAR_3920_1 [Eumeta japonica]